jgi:hypothetical protein
MKIQGCLGLNKIYVLRKEERLEMKLNAKEENPTKIPRSRPLSRQLTSWKEKRDEKPILTLMLVHDMRKFSYYLSDGKHILTLWMPTFMDELLRLDLVRVEDERYQIPLKPLLALQLA